MDTDRLAELLAEEDGDKISKLNDIKYIKKEIENINEKLKVQNFSLNQSITADRNKIDLLERIVLWLNSSDALDIALGIHWGIICKFVDSREIFSDNENPELRYPESYEVDSNVNFFFIEENYLENQNYKKFSSNLDNLSKIKHLAGAEISKIRPLEEVKSSYSDLLYKMICEIDHFTRNERLLWRDDSDFSATGKEQVSEMDTYKRILADIEELKVVDKKDPDITEDYYLTFEYVHLVKYKVPPSMFDFEKKALAANVADKLQPHFDNLFATLNQENKDLTVVTVDDLRLLFLKKRYEFSNKVKMIPLPKSSYNYSKNSSRNKI